MRVAASYTWRTQLGIQNALDYDGHVLITSRNANGAPGAARWMPGTTLVLTTGIKF